MKKITLSLVAILVVAFTSIAVADLIVKDGAGTTRTIKNFVCETTKLCNATVLIASDGTEISPATSAQAGSLTETAPASDTASSGLNGRLQRVAQRITSLIALISDGTDTAYGGSGTATLYGYFKGLYNSINGPIPAGTAEVGFVKTADGSQATIGAKADAKSTATDTTAVSGMSVWKQISASVQAIATSVSGTLTVAAHNVTNAGTFAVQNTTQAGELHIGEVGGNQIRVDVAQTVTASSAYTSGNAIGGKMTIAGAARVSGSLGAAGTGGILQQVVANSKSLQTTQVDVFLFNSDPSSSTCTDKTAFVLATADFDKVIGVASIPGAAANNSGWFAGGTGSVGQANNLAMAYNLSSATSIYACAVTRGTPTFTATSDISFKYQFLRN